MNKLFKRAGGLFSLAFLSIATQAQTVPQGWHLKDLKTDGYYGISLNKAYDFLKARKLKSTPVIVGIVDSGVDTTHEDLKDVLWINKKEIPGNHIDDDKDGYIDDLHGWNFLGSSDGKQNVEKDSYEAARVYWKYKSKFEGKTEAGIAAADKSTFTLWKKAKESVLKDVKPEETDFLMRMAASLKSGDSIIRKELKKEEYNCKDLASYTPSTLSASQVKQVLMATCKGNNNDDISNKMLLEEVDKDLAKANVTKAPPVNYRDDIVKDNYNDFNDKNYGNPQLYVSDDGALHGTHVAGIIGAERNNGIGMNGVADNVQIMSVRAVPDGDEHDKDIALAIRFAVDHGARVINMSFGKGFSPEKKWVDDAIRYADSKGVLIVHAAGNEAENIDVEENYPSRAYLDGKRPANFITVGASGDPKAGGLVANFSNYGKKEVDVFAPGVAIYSTLPGGNKYGNLQGTSMASPVVAGLAALIMSYFPNLTATQVKDIIEKSVTKPGVKADVPGKDTQALLSDISVTGGIVNAYEAVKLAAETKAGKASAPVKKAAKKR